MIEKNIVHSFLIGDMDAIKFVALFHSNSETRNIIRELIPNDAFENPDHPFWNNISFCALRKDNYDLVKHIERTCRFDNSIGDNLNIWGILKAAYKYKHPETRFTKRYSEMYDLYLDAIGNYYEGEEVEPLIQRIVIDAMGITSKTRRRKEVKEKMREVFHVKDSCRPYWIQAPEWPMGQKSPMRFVKYTRSGERVDYHFVDVDTNETRIVTQFY